MFSRTGEPRPYEQVFGLSAVKQPQLLRQHETRPTED